MSEENEGVLVGSETHDEVIACRKEALEIALKINAGAVPPAAMLLAEAEAVYRWLHGEGVSNGT